MKLIILKILNKLGLIVKLYNPKNSEEAMLHHLLDTYQINNVLDIGANIGQFASGLRKKNYKGNIISCEPLKEAFDELQKVAISDNKWSVYNTAVGREESESAINISQNSYSSSLLSIHENHTNTAKESIVIDTQKVLIQPLNNLYIPSKKDRTLLKIDTQGFEMEVLAGAKSIIKDINLILVELSMIPLYKNGPIYTEVIAELDTLGFELFQLYPEFTSPTSYRLLQANGFFIRKSIP